MILTSYLGMLSKTYWPSRTLFLYFIFVLMWYCGHNSTSPFLISYYFKLLRKEEGRKRVSYMLTVYRLKIWFALVWPIRSQSVFISEETETEMLLFYYWSSREGVNEHYNFWPIHYGLKWSRILSKGENSLSLFILSHLHCLCVMWALKFTQ